jgi:predicted transcriptional regulator
MDIIESFKARVEAAIEAHDLAPSSFSKLATGDPSFVLDLRKGKRSPHVRTIAKVDAYIAKLERKAAAAEKAKARARS